jgi:hypothetical protein
MATQPKKETAAPRIELIQGKEHQERERRINEILLRIKQRLKFAKEKDLYLGYCDESEAVRIQAEHPKDGHQRCRG